MPVLGGNSPGWQKQEGNRGDDWKFYVSESSEYTRKCICLDFETYFSKLDDRIERSG